MKRLPSVVAALAPCAVVLALAAVTSSATPSPALEFRFIGNEAFAISDGVTTLLTDFPYRPGYSGYMTYDAGAVRPGGRVVCLITHRHPDHFEPERFLTTDWTIVGPEEVTRALPAARVHRLGPEVTIGPDGAAGAITIRPDRTPHRDTEHYSYLVEWHGVRMYFVGDTEEPEALLAARDLDYAFVTPWLWDTVRRRGARLDARHVVIYHQTADEKIEGCRTGDAPPDCRVPRQGDRWSEAAVAREAGRPSP